MSLELSPPSPPATGGAPEAPGRLGASVTPQEAFVYLRDLAVWRDKRKDELDALDSAALASSERDSFSRDMLVSMALWKAISDRYDLLEVTFDNGRVGAKEAERISALIWGRLDVEPGSAAGSLAPSTSGALALSLPEACRLSDALVSQLRVRLGLEASDLEVTERLRALRAQMERIRDQVDLEPAGATQQAAAEQQARLARRVKDLSDKAGRGGDVGGLLGPLENEAATFERDLIVNGARRRDASSLVRRGREQRAELEARENALRALAADCVAKVDPAPRYAVPDVTALGPLPNTLDRLHPYLARLDQVSRAMTIAQTAYAEAVRGRDELTARLAALHTKAAALGLADSGDVAAAYELARNALAAEPTRMGLAEQLVAVYNTYLQTARSAPRREST